jgi:hypothetical protein
MKRPGDMLWAVWLREEYRSSRQIERFDCHASRGRDDADRRPAVSDRVRQLRPIHGSRHVNIRKYDLDVRAAFEDENGRVGIGSLEDFKSGIPDRFHHGAADQKLVLDDQDDRALARWLSHAHHRVNEPAFLGRPGRK